MAKEAAPRKGVLSICPTPLGNLGDISARTLDALRAADTVCAEDTRVTGRLLAAYGIEKRLERLDEASLAQKIPGILKRVLEGEVIAYCSDAGMPGVSDPGARLIAAARAAGTAIEVLPGPSAGVTAYVASGFACPHYYFGGFFPRKAQAREGILQTLAPLDAVLVFYESPKRLVAALEVIAKVFPARDLAVCRELTKLHEEVFRAPSAACLLEFSRRDQDAGIKGEVVIVIDAPGSEEQQAGQAAALEAAAQRGRELKAEGTLSTKDMARCLTEEFGIARNLAYGIVVDL